MLRFLLVERSQNADFVVFVLIEVEVVQMTVPINTNDYQKLYSKKIFDKAQDLPELEKVVVEGLLGYADVLSGLL